MKKVSHEYYKCEICGEEYSTAKEAKECESRPVSKDPGIEVGDRVRVMSGDGVGMVGTVERKWYHDKEWGHYAWERYWHTPGYSVCLDNGLYRQLCFDDIQRVD